jgi:RHS repeat-associated protein
VSTFSLALSFGAAKERAFTSRRVYKKDIVNSVTTEILYLHDGMNAIVERNKTGTPTEYVYGPTGIIAIKTPSSMNYVIKDHLGSTRVMINTTDLPYALTTYDYSAFGTILTTPPSSAYLYTGQEWDRTSGLHNFKARMYDGELGVFYGGDPREQFKSPYTYAGNNPILRNDPNGEIAPFLAAIIVGAVVGGFTGGAQAHMNDQGIWEGIGKGLLVGGVGGALGGIANPAAWGGFQSVLVGAAEGVATNGLSNVLNGDNFFQEAGTAAGIGGAFGLIRSEQFRNTLRGDGWKSNQQVFDEIMATPAPDGDPFKFTNKQRAINRFSPEGGEYNPGHSYFEDNPNARAFTDPKTGRVVFNKSAFNSYEQFRYTSFHEVTHVQQWMDKRYYEGMLRETPNPLEYEAYLSNYRNEGLLGGYDETLRKHTLQNLEANYPIIIKPGSPRSFEPAWWHKHIYRIPRVY